MALLCYNRGCGETYDPDHNKDDSCLFHPGVPIFHDALKGWSCCRKRTTDFSEFLSIKGCTRGRHSDKKPQEPLRPEVSSDKGEIKHSNGQEIIYQGPKSAEKLQKERPSSDESKTKLPQKVSASLSQALEKLEICKRAEIEQKENAVIQGTRCKNSGCKTVYQGPETNMEVCTHHPGAPVFHEGYKYWSCCCIKTIDFNAFLEQKGCTTGKHCWVPKQDKKKVACRHDWHQTGKNVVVTIYAKNANPEFSTIEANRTVLFCDIQFENNKIFKREFHLWGVIDVKQSSVYMVPSKVEISLCKADQVAWGKLEDPKYKPEPDPEPEEESVSENNELYQPNWDIDDDDISDSDEEWAYDTPPSKKPEDKDRDEQKKKEREILKRKEEVEEEMRRAMEERRRAEEEKKKLKEQMEEEEEGYKDMPDLE